MRDSFGPLIPEIFEAAQLLDQAVQAHIEGNERLAAELIRAADIQAIGDWLDPIWLGRSEAVKPIKADNLPPVLSKDLRHHPRHPSTKMKQMLVARDGHHCRFCGIPLVRAEVRKMLTKCYPDAARWASIKETDQHRGLQVMWLQYDHVLVHSRGGQTTLDNLVVACAACNFGRDRFTLEEMRFTDPRTKVRLPTWPDRLTWSGLEVMLPEKDRYLQEAESPFKPI